MNDIKILENVQNFLSLTAPDGDITYELVDGEAIPKMSPKFFHSRLTGALFLVLDRWNQGRGEVGIEWAIILSKNDRDWCPVPDLLYISPQRLGDIPLTDKACPVPPEYANLPQLRGRATIEMQTTKGDLTIVVDGYSAPINIPSK